LFKTSSEVHETAYNQFIKAVSFNSQILSMVKPDYCDELMKKVLYGSFLDNLTDNNTTKDDKLSHKRKRKILTKV